MEFYLSPKFFIHSMDDLEASYEILITMERTWVSDLWVSWLKFYLENEMEYILIFWWLTIHVSFNYLVEWCRSCYMVTIACWIVTWNSASKSLVWVGFFFTSSLLVHMFVLTVSHCYLLLLSAGDGEVLLQESFAAKGCAPSDPFSQSLAAHSLQSPLHGIQSWLISVWIIYQTNMVFIRRYCFNWYQKK